MGRAYSTHGRDEKFIQLFDGYLEGMIPLGKPMCKRKNNIKIVKRHPLLN
jgi:hypothetical protein